VLVYDKLSGGKDLGVGRRIILKWMNWRVRV
jgi:hypothetical protein